MQEERKILLLSGRIDQLTNIHDQLATAHITTIGGREITHGYYYGNQGSNKKKHRLMLQESAKCDVVLGTFAIASEGLDLPDLNTEIMATPVTDVEQSVGRILRKYHEKLNPIVVDLVDSCGNFSRQASVRAKFYREEDYEIQDLKIPLGLHPDDLKPFLPEIHKYLVNTDFQQTKFKEEESEEEPTKLGQCLLDVEVGGLRSPMTGRTQSPLNPPLLKKEVLRGAKPPLGLKGSVAPLEGLLSVVSVLDMKHLEPCQRTDSSRPKFKITLKKSST
jgi:hypothetical protein